MTSVSILILLTTLLRGAAAADESGTLVIIGGALRLTQTDVWGRIVELAGGSGARIAVIPVASAEPMKHGPRSVAALRAAGADAFLVPLTAAADDADAQKVANDAKVVDQVKAARGVYFIGGSQERITRALVSSTGDRTPLLNAIWDVYRRGGVVAGSSAGAAIMSHTMFRDAPSVLATLKDGVQVGKELAPGLGFLDGDWFVDQHFLTRGRFSRTLVAMLTLGLKFGVGVDDNTAVVVRGGREMSVVGHHGVIVLDLSQAHVDPSDMRFNVQNAKLSYLAHGDALDLRNLQLTPSAAKQADQKIDPNAADFHPARDRLIYMSDILGNNAVADVLGRLIDNKQPQALGLAFDTAEAVRGSTRGFEFRFYRGTDSKGWYANIDGISGYTVSNIHLDVRAVEIAGPLYK
jgi:cyanophycinase